MWRVRLVIYSMACTVAGLSGQLHHIADTATFAGLGGADLRAILGVVLNLAAVPLIEFVIAFVRREAVISAREAVTAGASQTRWHPQSADPPRPVVD